MILRHFDYILKGVLEKQALRTDVSGCFCYSLISACQSSHAPQIRMEKASRKAHVWCQRQIERGKDREHLRVRGRGSRRGA